jgi:hypothetical protein
VARPLSAAFVRKAAAYHRARALDEAGGDPAAALRGLRREIRKYAREGPAARREDLLAILRLAVGQLLAAEPPGKGKKGAA